MKYILLAIAAIFFHSAQAQNYPKNYFSAPLDTPLYMVGSFGEIRDDHFHTGIDFGTQEMEGIPVMAAAEGYVSRIKISANGYGKAIYITHPNGYVTVYGHLQKFNIPLYEFAKKKQYELQSFEIDETMKTKEFKVKKGEIIGYSGRSGSAEGPHLHFEIREEESEEPINPLLFGFHVSDTVAPKINFIRIYPLTENGIVNKTDTAQTYEVLMTEGVNIINSPDYIQAYGTIMFGVSATDMTENSPMAQLGIYSGELYIDNALVYQWKYDRLNFNDQRYVNAQIDYLTKVRDHLIIERAFRLPGNHLNIYGDTTVTGYQFFTEDVSHDIRFVVKDFAGNKGVLNFQVITYSTLAKYNYQGHAPDAILVTPAKGIAVHKSKLDVTIPSGAVYEDIYYNDAEVKSDKYASNIFRVGNAYDAIHQNITVGIKPNSEIADSLKPKAVIAEVSTTDKLKAYSSKWNNKFLSAQVKHFGDYVIALDTVPPLVEKEYVPTDINNAYGSMVKIKMSDELSGIRYYSVKIDGKWFLFEYNPTSKNLVADITSLDTNREHAIEVLATDECGNTTLWKSSFYY